MSEVAAAYAAVSAALMLGVCVVHSTLEPHSLVHPEPRPQLTSNGASFVARPAQVSERRTITSPSDGLREPSFRDRLASASESARASASIRESSSAEAVTQAAAG